MAARYSRLASVEEKRNLKKAGIFITLTIATLVAIFFFGIPLMGRFSTFVSDLGKTNKTAAVNDKTPPAPPRFNTFPDFTNQNSIELTGNSEAGANIKLTLNGATSESIADKNGHFTFNISLNDGDNTFTATATDTAGNVSQTTNDFKIVFDNKPPTLTVDNPKDGAQFVGSKQRQVTIQGTAEPDAQVTVNDRVVAVDDSGKFQFTTTLSDGENKFVIKATDKAGNTTESDITLSFVS